MKFSATHRITTHLTVLFAHLSLILSGEPISTWVSLIALICLGISFFWEPKPRPKPEIDRAGRISAGLGVLVVLYTVVDFWRIVSLGNAENLLLAPFSHLLLLFQSTRLFARRKSQDYLWIYIIGFFELITATAINEDPSYAFCFIGYSISITWALILFHLRREMEDNYLLRHSNDASSEKVEVERILGSKRIISSSFLMITGVLAFVVVLIGSFFSLLLPRMEGGPQVTKWRWQKLIGFSDKVSLGEFGRLRENLRVVMRINLPEQSGPLQEPLYLRGIVFDYYDVRTWANKGIPEETIPGKELIFPEANNPSEDSKTQRLSIILEPIDSAALFISNTSSKATFPDELAPSVVRDSLGNYSYNGSRHGVLRYELYSSPESTGPKHLSLEQKNQYTQRSVLLDPSIAELAKQIIGDTKDPYQAATLVRNYLRGGFTYSLSLNPDPNEPLKDFLFNTKSGHCQYFATAMAVLLRTQGFPTRLVNGFYGGEWNEYGQYYAIRQGDAHSWVEVFIDGKGWVIFDPTPTTPLVRDGWLGALGRAYDAARVRWFAGFIDYDLFAQQGLLQFAKSFFLNWGWLVGIVGLVGATLFALSRFKYKLLRWLRPTKKRNMILIPSSTQEEKPKDVEDKKKILRLYKRALDIMEKRGYPKAPSMTAREYAENLTNQQAPGADILATITQFYEKARFGEAASMGQTNTTEQTIESLSLRVKQLEREPLTKRPSPSSDEKI
jgi:transglutaminase-like putative cysteine protease